MEDILKNMIYQKINPMAIARNTLQMAINNIVEKGKITPEEGLSLFNDLSHEQLKTSAELEENFKILLHEFLEKSGIPSRAEFDSLSKRVVALELQDRNDL